MYRTKPRLLGIELRGLLRGQFSDVEMEYECDHFHPAPLGVRHWKVFSHPDRSRLLEFIEAARREGVELEIDE